MHQIEIRQIRILAAKEFRDRIRNRWVIAVAVIFTLFALAISYFGSAQQGSVGPGSIQVTIASLVSLVIYLIPLIALMLGYDAVVGERERGSLDLLLSLPITRFELLLGKFFGLSAAFTVATLAGFGSSLIAGIAIFILAIDSAGLPWFVGATWSDQSLWDNGLKIEGEQGVDPNA